MLGGIATKKKNQRNEHLYQINNKQHKCASGATKESHDCEPKNKDREAAGVHPGGEGRNIPASSWPSPCADRAHEEPKEWPAAKVCTEEEA